MQKINFVFWGTPDVASETLETLKGAGFLPSLIVTSPDKPAGRRLVLTPPPAKVWAEKNNIPFEQPENPAELNEVFLKDESANARGSEKKLHSAKPDLFIVVAYGQIIPEKILNLPRFGSINIHYSLLPKFRGASPVESAILNGATVTGVTLQKMAYKLDSGDILMQKKVEIDPDETAPELRKRLIKIGGEMLVELLNEKKFEGIQQNESDATHCGKIKKEDGLIDLNDDPVKNYNKFRAYAAWPRVYFIKDNKRVIITKARLEKNKFIIERVIPEGKKEIPFSIFR